MPITTSRSFYTSDSPSRASRVVSHMTVSDGFGGRSAPPGVSARQNGPGSFSARGPLGTQVSSSFSVAPARGGGSYVTEHTSSRSWVPGGAAAAQVIHAVATSPSAAYRSASNRVGY